MKVNDPSLSSPSSLPSPTDDDSRVVYWQETGDPLRPYATKVGSESWVLRINSFPDEQLYTLLKNGREVESFDDWPTTWNRPPSEASPLRELTGISTAANAPPQGLRILLAEPNLVNQRVTSRILEKRGYHVSVVGSSQEMLDLALEQNFDLIVMEVQMPDMSGLEATALIRKRERPTGAHTPIVALTACAMEADRERCLAAGMDGYISKPINAARFLDAVERTAAAFKA